MYLYGYWGRHELPPIASDGFDLLWPADSIEHRMRHWSQYLSLGIEAAIRTWPRSPDWREVLGRALDWFVRRGAIQ